MFQSLVLLVLLGALVVYSPCARYVDPVSGDRDEIINCAAVIPIVSMLRGRRCPTIATSAM